MTTRPNTTYVMDNRNKDGYHSSSSPDTTTSSGSSFNSDFSLSESEEELVSRSPSTCCACSYCDESDFSYCCSCRCCDSDPISSPSSLSLCSFSSSISGEDDLACSISSEDDCRLRKSTKNKKMKSRNIEGTDEILN